MGHLPRTKEEIMDTRTALRSGTPPSLTMRTSVLGTSSLRIRPPLATTLSAEKTGLLQDSHSRLIWRPWTSNFYQTERKHLSVFMEAGTALPQLATKSRR